MEGSWDEVESAISEIVRARDFLREAKLLDLVELSDEIRKLKEEINFMRYKPWEWFRRDKDFQRALMTEIEKRIAREVEQGLMLVLYEEKPKKVVEMVKKVVEDYLKKWELDDQIAEQIVYNVISRPEFVDRILKIIVPNIVRAVSNRLANLSNAGTRALKILEEYDILEKESRS